MFQPEQEVIWIYEQRGGWGFTFRVRGTVKKVTAKRVQIEVEKRKTGEKVLRWVKPEKLLATD